MKYDCTKTLDYFHERYRICKAHSGCNGCPLEPLSCGIQRITQETIDLVQKWSDKYPEKPRLTKREYEFLKTFLISMDKAVVRGRLMKDLYIHDTRYDTHYAIDPMMFSFIREEEQMTFNELLKLEVKE